MERRQLLGSMSLLITPIGSRGNNSKDHKLELGKLDIHYGDNYNETPYVQISGEIIVNPEGWANKATVTITGMNRNKNNYFYTVRKDIELDIQRNTDIIDFSVEIDMKNGIIQEDEWMIEIVGYDGLLKKSYDRWKSEN